MTFRACLHGNCMALHLVRAHMALHDSSCLHCIVRAYTALHFARVHTALHILYTVTCTYVPTNGGSVQADRGTSERLEKHQTGSIGQEALGKKHWTEGRLN